MPVVSQRQRRAMYAAKEGKSTLGIPKSVGADFIAATPAGAKLPESAPKKSLRVNRWAISSKTIGDLNMAKPKTLSDFRSLHDSNVIVPAKIREALTAMLKEGPEQWEYEADFVKRAGVSNTQIGAFREQFIDHIIEAPSTARQTARRVWFADPKVAKKLRSV